MGGTAMMASVILVVPEESHPKMAEARRRPLRVRSLMLIVGSDELLACAGFALSASWPEDARTGSV
jgi:hypothetical protein